MIEDIEIRTLSEMVDTQIPLFPDSIGGQTSPGVAFTEPELQYRVKIAGVWSDWKPVTNTVVDKTTGPSWAPKAKPSITLPNDDDTIRALDEAKRNYVPGTSAMLDSVWGEEFNFDNGEDTAV